MLTIESALTELCEVLRAETGVDVFPGRPDDAVAGIYVWPWRMWEDPALRNLADRVSPATGLERRASAPNLDFLVLVRPTRTLDDISNLSAARKAILDNPILKIEGGAARLTFENVDVDTLLNVFSAASIPLSVCLSVTMRING